MCHDFVMSLCDDFVMIVDLVVAAPVKVPEGMGGSPYQGENQDGASKGKDGGEDGSKNKEGAIGTACTLPLPKSHTNPQRTRTHTYTHGTPTPTCTRTHARTHARSLAHARTRTHACTEPPIQVRIACTRQCQARVNRRTSTLRSCRSSW